MTLRPPTIAEFIEQAKLYEAEEKRLCEPETLQLLADALEPPRGDPSRTPAERAAESAAYMIDRIINIPALLEPLRLAQEIANTTFTRSGIEWTMDGVTATLEIGTYWRRREPPSELAARLVSTLILPAPPALPDWAKLLNEHNDDPAPHISHTWVKPWSANPKYPTIYLVCPHAYLRGDPQLHLSGRTYDVERGLERAFDYLRIRCPVRLVPASSIATGIGVPDGTEMTWADVFDALYTQADALIICDVGGRAPGFTGGAMTSAFRSQFGPTLDLREADSGARGALQDLLCSTLDARVVQNLTPGDGVAIACASWLIDAYDDILAARRRRINTTLLYAHRYRELRNALLGADALTFAHAIEVSHISGQQLTKIIDQPEYLSCLPHTQLDSLLRVLQPPRRNPPESNPEVSRQGLREAAVTMHWTAEYEEKLWEIAQREFELVGAERRLLLVEAKDWIIFAERQMS